LKLEEAHVQQLYKRLAPLEPDSWTDIIDLGPLLFNLTLDSATEFLFGKSVHSQNSPCKSDRLGSTGVKKKAEGIQRDWSSFGQRFDRANEVVCIRGRLLDLYWLYNPRQFQEDCRHIHEFADHFVERALKSSSPEAEESSGKASGHGGYVFLEQLAKITQDPSELRSQLLNILLAGRDTTAGLLGWTFYLLARHPHEYQKLRKTIIDLFGPYSTDNAKITFESLKSCAYLQQVMSEVLRLHPIVPENSRRAVRNTSLPRGGGPDGQSPIYIRAGQEVVYNTHIMHRRKEIWGENANEFHPERWDSYRAGWEYIPFNGGPRICLGQQFALTEAGYVIVRLVQRFDKIENCDPSTATRHRFTSTTSPVKVLLRLHEAAS
jgi:cytochrome P450